MPTIPPPLTAQVEFPALGDAQFNSKAFAWATQQRTVTAPELAALAANVNSNAVEAQGFAAGASASAATAATRAAEAAQQPNVAASAANFRGTWAAQTPYFLGQAVVQDGRRYLALRDNTGQQPSTATLDWFEIKAGQDLVRKPTAVSPLANASGVAVAPTLSASAFATLYNPDTRTHRQFQVALNTDPTFANPVFNQTVNADSTTVSPNLAINTVYRWRCRDVAAVATSDWMDAQVFTTANISINTPTVSVTGSPSSVTETPTISTSAFATTPAGNDTHLSTNWEVRRTSDNALVYSSYNDTVNKTSITLPSGTLVVNTSYAFRAQHNGNVYGSSAYGSTTATTAANFNNYIATPTATPTNFGDPLEGGFYAGMIWNQRTQSATSQTIATGSKTFTTTDNMATTPLFYGGQTVEVRSRANPANRMIGTVTAATGTTLTVNVTSVGGTGTFTDWSIMARFRVIISPKATGENLAKSWKTTNDAGPTATQTLTEGFLASAAMVAAGAATYPAAAFCRGLSIGGFTDWYLPARDELELLWRNLKPTTDNNYVTADRPTGATASYQNLGSFGDTANTHGTNNNSAPVGAAYTTTVPGQVANTAFRTGGAEAMQYNATGNEYYWSSTEYSATLAWLQLWVASVPGSQSNFSKSSSFYVRAVRRSVI